MATYDYNEAIYGALCYIYGDDDNKISADAKRVLNHALMNGIIYQMKQWKLFHTDGLKE
jgi:hypothetical protein